MRSAWTNFRFSLKFREPLARIRPDLGRDAHADQRQELERPGRLVMVLQGLVTGTHFSVNQLPAVLQAMAKCLPQTYVIDAARRLLLPETTVEPLVTVGGLSPLRSDFLVLTLFLVALPALGWLTSRAALGKAHHDGGLFRWA